MKTTIIPFVCACLTATTMSAQSTLPPFKTANDFKGQKVTDLLHFVPTTGNYTLEASGQAGTPIHIRFGDISYTPEADCQVRFVQQAGNIYVFEGQTYKTTLNPTYTYSEEGENLLRNPGFESVGEQLADGRWQATDWETWNGGTPTWGGEVGYVNVRENALYCSEGTKTIILHSNSRWLCQQMEANTLQPTTAYRLTYDYWTSEGWNNGGITYQLQLGSGLAGNDIMQFEGHTTDNTSTSKYSYACVFQTPASLPADIYFSLYRAESRVDWLDNLRMVRIVPAAVGVTGTTSVTYATGAFAPENIILPAGICIDMSDRLTNPAFDDATLTGGAPTGWTLEGQVTQSKISTTEKDGGTIPGNQNHWQLWHANGATTGRAYQLVDGLPNGKYTIGATVVATGFGGEISLEANYGKTAIASGKAATYEATGIVVDGTLEAGLAFATTGGFTLDFDNFTLKYLGMDIDGYHEVLNIKLEEAKALLANLEEGYDAGNLEKVITTGENLGNEATAEELINAITAIDAEIAVYRTYAEEKASERKRIATFKGFIEAARQELESENYPGRTELEVAIAQAERTDTTGELTEAADLLNAAREAYYNSQYTVFPVRQTVSLVDTGLDSSEKFVLRIDGTPFYATNIQVRPDKLRGYEGWSEEEVEAVFKQAANDGFSTLSVPVFWSEVEPYKNHFDWRILDTYMNWCKKYGLRMELLWFSWSSGGRVQYLWNYNGRKQLRTPDYVCSMEGTSEFNMLRTEWEYSLDWRDRKLIERETYVLGRVMDHVALWDANNGNPHTVIGVQLGNEARSHGNNSATAAEIIDYYHQVGAAVKQSKYSTWTRLNCVSNETWSRIEANEKKRNNGGTNIDFVGVDVYGTGAARIKGNVDGNLGTYGLNYRMIMEIDAKDSWSPIYQMAALAGDKAFDYYNMGFVDGNGLYTNSGHRLVERSHINLVRQRNKILNLANQDIALKKQGESLYVYNYAGNTTNTETGIEGISFTPDVSNTQAIAIRRSNTEIVLLSTLGGTFSYPASLGVRSAQSGYYDENNQWVKLADVTCTATAVTMPETACVRLTTGEETAMTHVAIENQEEQHTIYSLAGQKIHTGPGKPERLDRGIYIINGQKRIIK